MADVFSTEKCVHNALWHTNFCTGITINDLPNSNTFNLVHMLLRSGDQILAQHSWLEALHHDFSLKINAISNALVINLISLCVYANYKVSLCMNNIIVYLGERS